MNSYPAWIHRIPELLRILDLAETEWIDRKAAEKLFGLRKTAAFHLLRRMGAIRCGTSLVISRDNLAKRLHKAKKNPDLRWAVERRRVILDRIQTLRADLSRKSVVRVAANPAAITVAGLPATIRISKGQLTIECQSFEDLLQQLVLFSKAVDADYEEIRERIESGLAMRAGS